MNEQAITLKVTTEDMALCDAYLNLDRASDAGKECSVLFRASGRAPDGLAEVDMEVCNGDTGPWGQVVLFDAAGNEMGCTEPFEVLCAGEMACFDVADRRYKVLVEVTG